MKAADIGWNCLSTTTTHDRVKFLFSTTVNLFVYLSREGIFVAIVL